MPASVAPPSASAHLEGLPIPGLMLGPLPLLQQRLRVGSRWGGGRVPNNACAWVQVVKAQGSEARVLNTLVRKETVLLGDLPGSTGIYRDQQAGAGLRQE